MQLRRPADAFTFYPRTTNFAPGRDVIPHVGPVFSVTVTREYQGRAVAAPRVDHPTYWSTREEADAHAAATLDASDPRTDPEAATTPADVLDACAHRDATSVAWMVDGAPLWRISVAVTEVHAPLADRYDLGRLARAVEAAVAAEGDSETAATWATRADEWERSMEDGPSPAARRLAAAAECVAADAAGDIRALESARARYEEACMDESDARHRCHGTDDDCQPTPDTSCRLGEGYARRQREELSQALDRAFARGASGISLAETLRDLRCDEATDEELTLGWAREQSAHDARIAARTTHEDAVEGRHVGCGYADCPHCAEVRA